MSEVSRAGDGLGRAAGGLAGAVGFLTVFGGARSLSRQATAWFPLVGLALGAALGWIWWAVRHGLSPLVAGAVVVVGDLVLTGMLHFDGLADSADGLLAPMDRHRRLEVMRDPRVGGFGAVAIVAALVLRWAALASMAPAPLLLAGLWCMSRSGMTLALATLPYARREGGLATGFGGGAAEGRTSRAATGGAGLALGAALAVLARHGAEGAVSGAAAAGAAAVGFAAVIGFGARRLGGYTGDVLGAAGVVGETLGLVVASAHL